MERRACDVSECLDEIFLSESAVRDGWSSATFRTALVQYVVLMYVSCLLTFS